MRNVTVIFLLAIAALLSFFLWDLTGHDDIHARRLRQLQSAQTHAKDSLVNRYVRAWRLRSPTLDGTTLGRLGMNLLVPRPVRSYSHLLRQPSGQDRLGMNNAMVRPALVDNFIMRQRLLQRVKARKSAVDQEAEGSQSKTRSKNLPAVDFWLQKVEEWKALALEYQEATLAFGVFWRKLIPEWPGKIIGVANATLDAAREEELQSAKLKARQAAWKDTAVAWNAIQLLLDQHPKKGGDQREFLKLCSEAARTTANTAEFIAKESENESEAEKWTAVAEAWTATAAQLGYCKTLAWGHDRLVWLTSRGAEFIAPTIISITPEPNIWDDEIEEWEKMKPWWEWVDDDGNLLYPPLEQPPDISTYFPEGYNPLSVFPPWALGDLYDPDEDEVDYRPWSEFHEAMGTRDMYSKEQLERMDEMDERVFPERFAGRKPADVDEDGNVMGRND